MCCLVKLKDDGHLDGDNFEHGAQPRGWVVTILWAEKAFGVQLDLRVSW